MSSSAVTRQRIQRMGRVLRKSSSKEKASIYTIYSSEHERERLVEESKRLVDEVQIEWFSLERNK